MKEKKLIRRQLDKTLLRLRATTGTNPPRKGWIRAIRRAIGMSARQLANRLRVSQQRVDKIEKQEVDGSLTIKSMRQVAEGLNCRLVYYFVPGDSLEETVSKRAKKIALQRLARASHSMNLEDQALSQQENDEILTEMIEELTGNPPLNFWDEQ